VRRFEVPCDEPAGKETMPDNTLTLYDVVKALALPPGSLIVALAIGVAFLAVGKRRLGFSITLLTLAGFYLLATPFVAERLAAMVQSDGPLQIAGVADPKPGAIVVLAAGVLPYAPEYEGRTVDEATLQRLAYAAYLYRRTGIPILVSGGTSREAAGSLAGLMKESLEKSFGVPVRWVEDRSKDTYENAILSAEVLRDAAVSRVLLVTHAAHMSRAAELFRAAGLSVTAAPTAFISPARNYNGRFLPRQSAFADSHLAIYELIGRWWYALRGRIKT
jgi:uncharacterized SAM-binding protein YcdF (DUF218 family)